MTTDIGAVIARLEQRLAAVERQSRLSHASLDNTALQVKDDSGGLRGILGQQGDGTTAALIVNGPPPPAPSTPIIASVLGGVIASWDGVFAAGAVIPLDWSRIEVHASAADGFTPVAATLVTTIETAQGATVVIPTDNPVYVRFLARSTSGTASEPSAQAGPLGPSAVVATDLLDGIVTEVKLANDAVTTAKIATSAVGTTEIADDAVTTPKIVAGAVQAVQIAAEAVLADAIAANAVTAGKIAALAITSDKIDANAVIAGKIAAGAVTANSLTVGIAQSIAEKLNDAMADSSMWAQVSGTGTPSWLTGVTDAVTGSTVLQSNGYCTMERQVNIPYDPGTLYRVTVRIRVLTAPTSGGAIALGLTGIATDGITRVNTAGTNTTSVQHFVAASGVTIAAGAGWTTYTGYIKGTAATGTSTAAPDPKAPGAAHTSVRYLRPLIRLLLNSPDGVAQVDQVTVETVPTGVVNTVNIANGAIIAGHLSVGSVDATALKADAITGKTITGGVINGAEFHSDDGAGGLVDIQDGMIEATGSSGWMIQIDPTALNPSMVIFDGNGDVAGAINGTGDNNRPALNISSGLFVDGPVTDWRWGTVMGSDGVTDGWTSKRFRNTDVDANVGGFLDLTNLRSRIGYINNIDPGGEKTSYIAVSDGLAWTYGARTIIQPPASTQTALFVVAEAGHAGALIRASVDGVDKFYVTNTGQIVGASSIISGNASAGTLTVAGKDAGRGLITSLLQIINITNISTANAALMTTASMTFVNGRAYRVEMLGLMNSTTAGAYALYQVVKGTTAAGAVIRGQMRMPLAATSNTHQTFSVIITNTTGANITTALTATGSVSAGVGQFSGSVPSPATMSVADIGLAADWPGASIT